MSGEFKARALELFRAGHRVVPIPKGHKRVVIEGWPALADTQDEANLGELIKTANECGVGILSKWTAGVDIDVRDGELAQKLAGLAHTILGSTVERIGEAPKLLLPYRVEKPFAKVSSHSFRLPGDQVGDKLHRVEILCDGQQWAAYHVHPDTKRPYHWPDGDLPAREDLPELDEARARLFIERAEAAIVAHGGRIEAPKVGGNRSGQAKASLQGQVGTYEAIADAMRHIGNPGLDYDDWVTVGMALKGALGENGRELWDGWSELSDKNNPAMTAKVWGHAKPTTIGAGTIYHLARQAGWKPDRKLRLNPEKAKTRTREEPPPHPGDADIAPRSEPLSESDPGRARGKRANANGATFDWWGLLLISSTGFPRDCVANVCIVLRHDQAFVGRLSYNALKERTVVGSVPWHETAKQRDWTDRDDTALSEWCQLAGLIVRPPTVASAVQHIAAEHTVNPLVEKLDALEWDGLERLDAWLEAYLGVTPSNYSRKVGRSWMVSAVARAYRPGCQADHALILEGSQGIGKSRACRVLAFDPEWFTDEIADLGTKDSAQDLPGKWNVELGELAAMRRSDVERVKAFMSRTFDHYRPSYARRSQDFPRRCVFIGSTNADQYLADDTGNRRFWPVTCGEINLAGLRLDVDQLWAEAVRAFKAGEKWWLDVEAEGEASVEQDQRQQRDVWTVPVLEWAQKVHHGYTVLSPEVPPRVMHVASADVTIEGALEHALGIECGRHDRSGATRVGNIMRAAKWIRREKRVGGRPTRYYVPPTQPDDPVAT